jgi:hypothetical protein
MAIVAPCNSSQNDYALMARTCAGYSAGELHLLNASVQTWGGEGKLR